MNSFSLAFTLVTTLLLAGPAAADNHQSTSFKVTAINASVKLL